MSQEMHTLIIGDKTYEIVDQTARERVHIVDSGTSGIWSYRKWSDGKSECWGTGSNSATSWKSWGSLYYSDPYGYFNYPSGLFVSAPLLFLSGRAASGDTMGMGNTATDGSATQTPGLYAIRPSTTGATTIYYKMYAIGRWK